MNAASSMILTVAVPEKPRGSVMIVQLLRAERGMVLGLAIIVVVVIGVMGAGLLTFVSADLQAVVAVNRGEQAFELAEAGIEIAKAHLAADPSPATGPLEGSTWTAWATTPSPSRSSTTTDLSRWSPPASTAKRSARSKPPSMSKMAG